MAERIRGIAGNGSLQGLAKDGIAGLIPGKVNPKVADDVTINAKKGEYVLSVDDVKLLGGPKAVEAMVQSLRKQAGIPTETGPKRHDQPDSQGRMDKPGLRGIAGLAGGGALYGDELGNVTPRRPMTLQENYGMPRNVPAGRIEHTGAARPVGPASGLSRPGVIAGEPSATQVPVNPRNLPAVRPSSVPAARGIAGDMPSPVQPIKQIGYEPKVNIDTEVRARLNQGSRAFVGPREAPAGQAIATPGNTTNFGGRAGAHVIDPSGGLAGALYRKLSKSTGRYIPGIDSMWGAEPASRDEMQSLVRDELSRTMPSHNQVNDPKKVFAGVPVVPTNPGTPGMSDNTPVDAPLRFANMGLGPADLSRTSTGALPSVNKPAGIADGVGTGFAEVGGQRINYRDIGTGRDPLTTRRDGIASAPDGQTLLIGNPQGYKPSRHLDWSPDSANVNAMRGIAGLAPVQSNPANQESADQLALRDRFQETRRNTDAGRVQANNELISLHQQIANSPSMIGNQYNGAEQIAASRRSIADLGEQNKALQVGINGDKALEAHRIAADASLAGHQIAGDATVRSAELGALGREAAARAAHENDLAKSSAADRKDEEKRIFDLAKSWAKSATGMEHPDDVRTAHAYILGKSDFNKRFDTFMDGLKPHARQFWISGFKSRDPQVLAELAKRGIVDPAEPQFPSRQSALGGA